MSDTLSDKRKGASLIKNRSWRWVCWAGHCSCRDWWLTGLVGACFICRTIVDICSKTPVWNNVNCLWSNHNSQIRVWFLINEYKSLWPLHKTGFQVKGISEKCIGTFKLGFRVLFWSIHPFKSCRKSLNKAVFVSEDLKNWRTTL